MKKIVIVGGFGFLGKNLQNVLKSDEYQVYPISRRNGYDLFEKNKIITLLNEIKPDYLINCAAYVGSLEYVNNHVADVISNNILMGINLWDILKEVKFSGCVINPISNCTYPGNSNIQKEDEWWNGMVHPSIISYGTSKKTIYMINRCYEKQYGIKTINIIMPNSYGEHDYDDENRVHALNGIVIRMIKSIKNNESEFVIWGSGTPIREWGYMPDTARFFKYLIDNDIQNIPNPINIGQNMGYSINEITDMIKKELKSDVNIKNDLSKIDGDPIKILDGSKFKELFPNFIFTELNQGIKNTIEYYKPRIN